MSRTSLAVGGKANRVLASPSAFMLRTANLADCVDLWICLSSVGGFATMMPRHRTTTAAPHGETSMTTSGKILRNNFERNRVWRKPMCHNCEADFLAVRHSRPYERTTDIDPSSVRHKRAIALRATD